MPSNPDRIERSVLATPGSNPRMIEKAIASAADLVFLDLEDAVTPELKAPSRVHVIRALQKLDWGAKPRAIRVNSLDTPYFYRDLIDIVVRAGDQLDLVIVPKVARPADVYVVDTLLTQIERDRGFGNRIGLEVQIESAEGLLNCATIAAASPRLEAIVFGPGDYAATIGMPLVAIGMTDEWDAAYGGDRLHYARHQILVAGRVAGLRVIDGPYADFRDEGGLRSASLATRALGFDGKWCIHPAQIGIVNEIFSPTATEIAWSRRVVDAYAAAERDGRGAIELDGKMIDMASIRMARSTLARVKLADPMP